MARRSGLRLGRALGLRLGEALGLRLGEALSSAREALGLGSVAWAVKVAQSRQAPRSWSGLRSARVWRDGLELRRDSRCAVAPNPASCRITRICVGRRDPTSPWPTPPSLTARRPSCSHRGPADLLARHDMHDIVPHSGQQEHLDTATKAFTAPGLLPGARATVRPAAPPPPPPPPPKADRRLNLRWATPPGASA